MRSSFDSMTRSAGASITGGTVSRIFTSWVFEVVLGSPSGWGPGSDAVQVMVTSVSTGQNSGALPTSVVG